LLGIKDNGLFRLSVQSTDIWCKEREWGMGNGEWGIESILKEIEGKSSILEFM